MLLIKKEEFKIAIPLYYQDVLLTEFKADIINIIEKNDKYHLELNKTAFYPEGGGQPADYGYISGIRVLDVYKKDDKIFHVVAEKPLKDKDITCQLDWDRRFDHMQQHTGQHLLSAIILREYTAQTIGFHLGDDYVSIDLDKMISDEELRLVEIMVNRIIYENKKIEVLYPEGDELSQLELRKEPTVTDNIRIVNIEDIDLSPCGGTHLKWTGQLGILKIIDSTKYKDGIRIKFLCGQRALKDYQTKHKIIGELKNKLSVQEDEIVNEVKRILNLNDEQDKLNKELQNRINDYQVQSLLNDGEEIKGIKIHRAIFSDEDFQDVRYIAGQIIKKTDQVVLFGHKDESAARLIFQRSKELEQLKMNEIIKSPLEMIAGNGGGSPLQAQGGGKEKEGLESALNTAVELIKNIIEK